MVRGMLSVWTVMSIGGCSDSGFSKSIIGWQGMDVSWSGPLPNSTAAGRQNAFYVEHPNELKPFRYRFPLGNLLDCQLLTCSGFFFEITDLFHKIRVFFKPHMQGLCGAMVLIGSEMRSKPLFETDKQHPTAFNKYSINKTSCLFIVAFLNYTDENHTTFKSLAELPPGFGNTRYVLFWFRLHPSLSLHLTPL